MQENDFFLIIYENKNIWCDIYNTRLACTCCVQYRHKHVQIG